MNYQEAVDYVMKEKADVYNLSFRIKAGKAVGAEIYYLRHNTIDKFSTDEEPPYFLHFEGQDFGEEEGEEDIWAADEVEEHIKRRSFQKVSKGKITHEYGDHIEGLLEEFNIQDHKEDWGQYV